MAKPASVQRSLWQSQPVCVQNSLWHSQPVCRGLHGKASQCAEVFMAKPASVQHSLWHSQPVCRTLYGTDSQCAEHFTAQTASVQNTLRHRQLVNRTLYSSDRSCAIHTDCPYVITFLKAIFVTLLKYVTRFSKRESLQAPPPHPSFQLIQILLPARAENSYQKALPLL